MSIIVYADAPLVDAMKRDAIYLIVQACEPVAHWSDKLAFEFIGLTEPFSGTTSA